MNQGQSCDCLFFQFKPEYFSFLETCTFIHGGYLRGMIRRSEEHRPGAAVLHGLGGEGGLAQVCAGHLWLGFHPAEGLAAVLAHHAAQHLSRSAPLSPQAVPQAAPPAWPCAGARALRAECSFRCRPQPVPVSATCRKYESGPKMLHFL